MPKYTKKPVEVEAFKLGFEKIPQWFKDHMKCLVWLFSYKGPYTDVIEKRGSMSRVVRAYEGDYIVKYKNGDVKVMSPVVFEHEFEKAHDTAVKKARKMAELSGILTKNGFDFKEKSKEEEIEKVESFEFNFGGKAKSKIKYSTIKDGSRYHTERAFFNFELDDILREELQNIIGHIAEHFFENDKTLPMIEHTGITNAKIHNIPAGAITGINADFSGVKLDIPVKTAKIKDLSADKIKPGPIENPEISPANSFEIEREAHKKLIKELIREVLSEKPVTMSLDGEEVGKACFKEVSKVMKRQNMRSK
ncbi:hypothetical protein ABE387_05105 [Bacillus licheniformis]|uniref:hypothetical protein n=1 Tax=Bacillus licheniformis TaxID=1402 RepID=UPI002DBCAFC0|nr:hypothetical protein [Bacillus licheniformis]MEC1863130.1 hypothetical protein [Bacillus licheniformis]